MVTHSVRTGNGQRSPYSDIALTLKSCRQAYPIHDITTARCGDDAGMAGAIRTTITTTRSAVYIAEVWRDERASLSVEQCETRRSCRARVARRPSNGTLPAPATHGALTAAEHLLPRQNRSPPDEQSPKRVDNASTIPNPCTNRAQHQVTAERSMLSNFSRKREVELELSQSCKCA